MFESGNTVTGSLNNTVFILYGIHGRFMFIPCSSLFPCRERTIFDSVQRETVYIGPSIAFPVVFFLDMWLGMGMRRWISTWVARNFMGSASAV